MNDMPITCHSRITFAKIILFINIHAKWSTVYIVIDFVTITSNFVLYKIYS